MDNYAGFLRRLSGTLIDIVITMPVAWVIYKSGVSRYFLWPQIPHFLFEGVYYISFWTIKGAAPGMMLMKIKIVTDKGSLTLWRGIIRFIGACISSFCWGLGGLWMLWDKRKQTWQDKMVGTFVVKVEMRDLA